MKRSLLTSQSLALVLLLAGRLTFAQDKPLVDVIETVSMTVSDLDRSIDFYTGVLSFRKVSEKEVAGEEYERLEGVFGLRMRIARLTLGDESIELVEYLAPKGLPIPLDSRSNDRWFQHVAIIVSDMDRAYQVLRENKVEHASPGPQRLPDWNKNAGGIEAFYFKDPDGHPLEILQFPAGKGNSKWQMASGRLFLGIDHTAIVVDDTQASLRLYRDILGLRVAGESENYGIEQERLNNVFGAHLRITALRAASGIGIELLEYLTPRNGRPLLVSERANDLVHRETVLVTRDPDGTARRLTELRYSFVSQGVIGILEPELGFRKSFLVRDPDGHVIHLTEK